MVLISRRLYEKIPLHIRLNEMSMKKLIKVAWKEYGIFYNASDFSNKSDLIRDIIYCIEKNKQRLEKYKGCS